MAEQNGEKSQDATPHRREQAREQGEVARSQDLGSAMVLLGSLFVLMVTSGAVIDFLGNYSHAHLGGDGAWLSMGSDTFVSHWHTTVQELAVVLAPALGMMMLIGVAANMLQVGFLFLPDKLMPDLKRIDPLKGVQRILSLTGVVRLGFGLLKVVIISVVAWFSLAAHRDEVLGLGELALPQLAVWMLDILFWTSVKIAGALFLLALVDYGFQWWKHEQDLRMTTQEVREEMKNLQGDPQIIARRRAVQRQLAIGRLSATVPKADVVVTNPTELAIAIQYDSETMAAPIVLAKGAGVLAQRIRELAREHNIPIIEKKPLARALYKDVEVNRPIPSAQYAAVAEILAYVYQLKGKKLPGAA